MRGLGLAFVAVIALGAHCPHSPWAYAPEPAPTPRSQVFFDSGAVLRAYLQDGDVVTGRLLASFAPGGQQLVVCGARRAPCGQLDATGARTLPLTAIQQLKFPGSGTGIGADLGFRFGGIVALSQDREDVGLFGLGMLGGAVLGGAIGSRVTRWITVAERFDSRRLTWVPEFPVLIPLPPAGYQFTTACNV